jgi:hypothetical protein
MDDFTRFAPDTDTSAKRGKGRPSIGPKPLTSTERSRKSRETKRKQQPPVKSDAEPPKLPPIPPPSETLPAIAPEPVEPPQASPVPPSSTTASEIPGDPEEPKAELAPAPPANFVASPVAPEKSAEVGGRIFVAAFSLRVWSFLGALGLTSVSGFYSIVGLTSIFAGAYVPVIALGIAVENGKLAAVSCLGFFPIGKKLKASLIGLVCSLVFLNWIGCYGYLAKAHFEHSVPSLIKNQTTIADIQFRIEAQERVVADYEKQIKQIDDGVDKSISGGRTQTAANLSDLQGKKRAGLAAQRKIEADKLTAIRSQKAEAEGLAKVAEAEQGPIKYLALLIHIDQETLMSIFIVFVAVIFDPLALILMLTATHRRPQFTRRSTVASRKED